MPSVKGDDYRTLKTKVLAELVRRGVATGALADMRASDLIKSGDFNGIRDEINKVQNPSFAGVLTGDPLNGENEVFAAIAQVDALAGKNLNTQDNSCKSGCTGSCYTGCKGSCTGCGGNCTGGCSTGCGSGCSGGCTASCQGTCMVGCTGNCYSTCLPGCAGTCLSCTSNCSAACAPDGGTCQSTCITNCVNQAAIA